MGCETSLALVRQVGLRPLVSVCGQPPRKCIAGRSCGLGASSSEWPRSSWWDRRRYATDVPVGGGGGLSPQREGWREPALWRTLGW